MKFVSGWVVPQPTGKAVTNTHLLRAAIGFMVLGVIGPGLFQLKPPQWFGEPDALARLEPVASPEASVPTDPPARVATAETPERQPAAVDDVVPEAATPPPAMQIAKAPAPSAPETKADAPAPRQPTATSGAEPVTPALRDGAAVMANRPAKDTAAPPAVVKPERPAVVARKALPMPPPAAVTPEQQETRVASLSRRTTKFPVVPGSSPPPPVVRRDFVKQIPESHVTLPVKRQKESFIAITLPLILAANEEISQRREAIIRAASRGDRTTVERWARLYRLDTDGRQLAEIQKQLLLRADFIPVSLALAQAAIESGWGTSRFALQGNALFGQWAWQEDAGLKPARASNSNAVVRSFPNLFGSVRAYMHNLNTHPRYAAFRARRHLLRGRTRADLGYQLSNFLDGYAEIGEVYVAKLKTLIRSNEFGQYEAARLR